MRIRTIVLMCSLIHCSLLMADFREDFADGLAGYTTYGSPQSNVVEAFGRSSVFDNNGDGMYGSGIFSDEVVSLAPDTTLSVDAYIEVTDPTGCWVELRVGVTDGVQKSNDQYGVSELFEFLYIGDACWASPSNQHRHAYLLAGGASPEQSSDYLADDLTDRWVTIEAKIETDYFVSLYVDGVFFAKSMEPLPEDGRSGHLLIGGRSSGSAGKIYADDVSIFDSWAQPRDNPVAVSGIDVGPYDTSWIESLPWDSVQTTAATPDDGTYNANGLLTAGDDLATVQAEIFNLSASGGGVLYFPAGQYDFSDHLYLADGVILRGATPGETDAIGSYTEDAGHVRTYDITYDPETDFRFPLFEQDYSTSMRPGDGNRDNYFKQILVGKDDGAGGIEFDASSASNLGMVNIDVNGAVISINDRNDPVTSTWGTEIPKNEVTNKNILIFGNRLNNGTVLEPDVPSSGQNAWQVWPARSRGRIDVVSAGNTLIANNSLMDMHYKKYVHDDDSVSLIDYEAPLSGSGLPQDEQYLDENGNAISASTTSSDVARFSDAHGIRLNHVSYYRTAHSAVQEPSKHREGQGIVNNFVFGTTRVGFTGAGNGLVVKGNVREDLHGTKREIIDLGGREKETNGAASFGNRGIEVTGGHGVLIDDNYVRVQRGVFDNGYETLDGEGIYLQEVASTHHPFDWTVSNNILHNFSGLYRIRYADGITLENNTVYGGALFTDGVPGGNQGRVGGAVSFINNTASSIYARYNLKPRNLEVTGSGNTPALETREDGNLGSRGQGFVEVDAIPGIEFVYPNKEDLASLSAGDTVTLQVRIDRDPADTTPVAGVKVWDGITNYPANGLMSDLYWTFDGNSSGEPAGIELTLASPDAATGALGGGVYEGTWTVPAEFDLRGLLVAEVRLDAQTGVTGDWIEKAWAFASRSSVTRVSFEELVLSFDDLATGVTGGQADWSLESVDADKASVASGGLGYTAPDGAVLEGGSQHLNLAGDPVDSLNNWLTHPIDPQLDETTYIRFLLNSSELGTSDNPGEFFLRLNGWGLYFGAMYFEGVIEMSGGAAFAVDTANGLPLDTTHMLVMRLNVEGDTVTSVDAWFNPEFADDASPDLRASGLSVALGDITQMEIRSQNTETLVDEIKLAESWPAVVPDPALQSYTLTTTASTGGSVQRTPDNAVFAYEEDVVLSPVAEVGYRFAGWEGDAGGTTDPLVVTMDGNKTIHALFEKRSYTVTFDLGDHGTRGGGGALEQEVNHGESALAPQVEAEAGWEFVGWDRSFDSISGDRLITAQYGKKWYSLTTEVVSGEGVVTPSPDNTSYEHGSQVTLTATPHAGYRLGGWAGDASGATTPVTLTMDGDKTVEVTFVARPTATITAPDTVIIPPGSGETSVELDGRSSRSGVSMAGWEWSWEGGSASGEVVSHGFAAGTYEIVLIATDEDGYSALDNHTLTVLELNPPTLTQPADGAVLGNSSMDGTVVYAWSMEAHIPDAYDSVDIQVLDPDGNEYHRTDPMNPGASFTGTVPIGSDRLTGWTWRARSVAGDLSSDWSETRAFQVQSRVIAVSGDLAFGRVGLTQEATATLTIENTGTHGLTIREIQYPAGFVGNYTGTIAAGEAEEVSVTFTPGAEREYNGEVVVLSDATEGDNRLSVSGEGFEIPYLSLDPAILDMPAAGGAVAVELSSNVAWEVANTANWVSLSAVQGSGDVGLTITVQQNQSFAEREAQLVFTSPELTDSVILEVRQPTPFSGAIVITGPDNYRRGSSVECAIVLPADLPDHSMGLGFTVELPSGWWLESQESTASPAPHVGQTEQLEWIWLQDFPNLPYTFRFKVGVPYNAMGDQTLGGYAVLQGMSKDIESSLTGITLRERNYHSADYAPYDRRFNLMEILSVIGLYNHREGTVRTGHYHAEPTADSGYAEGAATEIPAGTRPHSADYRGGADWSIDFREMMRVIWFYNYRAEPDKKKRTGEYHLDPTEPDGFNSGPAPTGEEPVHAMRRGQPQSVPEPSWLVETGAPMSADGGTVVLTVDLGLPGDLGTVSAVGLEIRQPEGWSFGGDDGTGAFLTPKVGDTNRDLGWAWMEWSSVPENFSVTLHYPAGEAVARTLAADVFVDGVNTSFAELVVEPAVTLVVDPLLDPDNNGINNLLEFAQGGAAAGGDQHSSLPQMGWTEEGNETYLTFRYRKRTDAAFLVYGVEWSSDMSQWNALGTLDGAMQWKVDDLSGGLELWEAKVPYDEVTEPRFLRLEVQQVE